jgi:hypothetical protein
MLPTTGGFRGIPLVEAAVVAAPTVALLVALHRFHRRGLDVLFEVVRRNPHPEARLRRPLAAPPVSSNALWLHAAAAAARMASRWLNSMAGGGPPSSPWGAAVVDAVALKLLSDLHSGRARAVDLVSALRNSQELAVGSAPAGVAPDAAKRQREQRLSLAPLPPVAAVASWFEGVPFGGGERPHLLLLAAPCAGLAGLLSLGEPKGAASWATGFACFGVLADAAALTSQLIAFDRKRDYFPDSDAAQRGPNAHRWLIRAYCAAVAASLVRYGIDTGDVVVRQVVSACLAYRDGGRGGAANPEASTPSATGGDPATISAEVKVAAAGLVAALAKTAVLVDFLRA